MALSPESGSSDSSSDAQSESSTIIYDHESFAQFQAKVLAFTRSCTWLPSYDEDEITVERLHGGTFNRVIGLTFTSSQRKDQDLTSSPPTEKRTSETVSNYILRIPRFKDARVDDDVAVLLFVKRLPEIELCPRVPEISVPEIIAFDETENNCLGSCFMVQKRLPGQPLVHIYPQLGHEKQRRVARDLGHVYRRMLSVWSTHAGRLVLPEDNKSLHAEIHVTSWDPRASIFFTGEQKPRTSAPYRSGRSGDSVLELLRRTFQEQKTELRKSVPSDTLRPHLFDRVCKMVSEMDAAGYFKEVDGHFALSHLDLEPRNILADLESPPDGQIISGILDWDSAVLAPAFMSCAPPMWIWDWQEDEHEDERLANEEPATPEQKELKTVFETAAGPQYVRCAYHPAYRLARRLVRFAIDGIRSSEDVKEAEAMLGEWQSLLLEPAVKATTANVRPEHMKSHDI
ncbi:hypothetical protein INS49_004651 [Diaporthe citri]|uniref:uncharacterized protein n=1 Tax=Diaporthe citri TaxID=83186 RepID=UPI001C818D51|nr:uncharacterized protein INS49_004651 [Diaporthe citri]KAG6354633.1 hypothetical protein INS49_004651 [Diaporthe citri]